MTEKDNLIAIDFSEPMAIIRKKNGQCYHAFYEVDGRSLKVFCRDCEAEIEPIKAVLMIADRWSRHAEGLKQLKKETSRVSEDLKDLRRQRENLKAQVKRLKKKLVGNKPDTL